MTHSDRIELKKSIQEELKTLESEISELLTLLAPIKKDCSLDTVAHQSLKQEQNINIQRYEKTRKRVIKLQNALIKIDTQEYGVCQECEEDIPIERLKIMPESLYCVACMNELGM